MIKGPRVLALTGGGDGPTLWRVWQPYTELQRFGYGAWFRHKDDPEMLAPEWPYLAATRLEAIVIPRFSWREHAVSRRWVNTLHKAGLAVIYDLDDDTLSPQIGARQHATTEQNKSLDELEQDRRDRIAAIRICDGVTTSTAQLGRVIEQYVDVPVLVVPNRIDVAFWRRTLHGVRRTVDALTIGWAGGARYTEDLAVVAEAWHNVARRYPSVRFVVAGYPATPLLEAVPIDRVVYFPWTTVAEYPGAMRNIDIGCASVTATHFNQCKTPIKAWELTLAGATVVVSPTLYSQVVTDEGDGLIADTAAEWEAALVRLIDDPQLRRRLWRNQRRRIATEHTLSKHALDWPRAWTKILESFRARRALAA